MDFLELAKQRCTTRGFTEQRISEKGIFESGTSRNRKKTAGRYGYV